MNQDFTLKNKKILITGGAGFIGSNLCEELIKQGCYVTCLDNFSTGKIENILPFISHPNFKLMVGDIRNLEDCRKSVEGVDYILHEAALGSVPRSIKDAVTTNEVNISGFLNMLVTAKDKGIKRFIFAASSSTYGDSQSLPKVEDIIGKPLSPYAITKYVNELYAEVFHRIYGLEYVGLRYFNVFGQRQDPFGMYAAVIPLFIKKLMAHESPLINGDGEYSRDFTYIKNVVQMNILALTSDNPKAINTIYNTAYGERTTLNELIHHLKQYLGTFDPEIANIEIKHGPIRTGDIPHSLASISKAKKLLNYSPAYNLEEGIKEAINWYWNNI